MQYSIIFGLGPAGLFLGRQLAKNDLKVIGIGRHDDVGIYSKYIKGFIAETKVEIMSIINELVANSTDVPKAYICSDQYLTMLLCECPEIFEKVNFIGVNKETFNLINNKKQINDYCRSIGINLPISYKYDDILNDKEIEFPLIFKLNSKEINNNNNPIGKIKIINNDLELKLLVSDIYDSTISYDDIIVQSYLPGDNSFQFSFGGYFIDGVEQAGIVVNQLRQYPQGVSSFVIETSDKTIVENIIKYVIDFAKPIKYTGFLEMEFKMSNEKLFLMDINPRTWGWVSILGKKYINFHDLFSDNKNIKLIKNDNLVMWKSPIRDFIGKYKNPLNVRRKLYSKAINDKNIAYDIHDANDIKPSYAIYKVGIRKILKKSR